MISGSDIQLVTFKASDNPADGQSNAKLADCQAQTFKHDVFPWHDVLKDAEAATSGAEWMKQWSGQPHKGLPTDLLHAVCRPNKKEVVAMICLRVHRTVSCNAESQQYTPA